MAGYTRSYNKNTGDTILASDFNTEYQAIDDAFNETTGHSHDGSTDGGAYVGILSDVDFKNCIVVDVVSNELDFFIEVGGIKTQQFKLKDGVIEPEVDNDIDLGSAGLEFKNLYLDGVAYIDQLYLANDLNPVSSILDEDTMTSNSATALATQQSIKAYVDTHMADTTTHGTTTAIVGVDDIQTLTNKTLTAPVISTISNTGTLTLPTSTDTLVGRDTTDTLTNKTLTAPVISTISNTGTLTLPTSTDTMVGRDTTDTLTNKTIAYASNTLTGVAESSGTQTVWIPASSMTGVGSGVSATYQLSSAYTHGQYFPSWAFDSGADNSVMFTWMLPGSYSGTTTIYLYWTFNAAGSGTVVWDLDFSYMYSNADTMNGETTQNQSTTDTAIAEDSLHITPGITVSTTGYTANDIISAVIRRDVSVDTLAVDAILLGARIEYSSTLWD